MERISRLRAVILLIIFSLVLTFYTGKLVKSQLIDHAGGGTNQQTYTSYTTVKAARGDLLDRNGNVLVGNRASYNLVFIHYVINSTEGRNEYLRTLLEKTSELGLTHTDHLPITKERPFEYTLADYSSTWQSWWS